LIERGFFRIGTPADQPPAFLFGADRLAAAVSSAAESAKSPQNG